MSAALQPNPQSAPNDGAPDSGAQVPFAGSGDTDTDLLDHIIGWHKVARDHWQEWRQEAAECYEFRAGKQWADEDLQILQDQMRPSITFNRIGPFVDAVGGLEVNNRQETLYAPRQVGASGVNDLLTGAAKWARDECDAEDEESEAFLDVVTCGIGCVQTRMDYDEDPDGLIKIDRIDPLEMLPDPNARKQNFADARKQMRIKDIPIEDARSLFPGEPDENLHAQWAEDQPDETRSPHNARIAPYYRIDQSGRIDRDQQMVRLVEVEWWEYAPAYRVLDPSTGRFVLLTEKQASSYATRARLMGLKPYLKRDRRKWYRKAIVGAVVLKTMDGPEKGGFTYKFITGKRDAMKGTWFGIVRAMRDPQMWANKWLSQGLHIVNTNAKGGLLAEADAFDDPDEARDSWAEADSITLLNPGGLSKVQQKEPPAFPQQINQMSQMAIDAIPMVAGINMELMGQTAQPNGQQVGVVEAGRRAQGMNVLAALFNAKRRYQKEQGRLLLWMIQTFIADGRLIRIGGPENAQYVPLVHEPGVAEYDVIVEDAPTSPNTKDKIWAALMALFPMLRGMAIPPQFYINALKYSPVPASFATEAQQILSQPPPPNPAMQGKAQLDQATAALRQAQAAKAQAEAQAMPDRMQLEGQETAASIELKQAQATNQYQNAGLATHAALQDVVHSAHSRTMDVLTHAHQVGRDAVSDAQPQVSAAPVQGVPG